MNGNRLKEFREGAKLTQTELARRASIAGSNLNAIENGRMAAWPKAKRKLARVLKQPIEVLFPPEGSESDAAGK